MIQRLCRNEDPLPRQRLARKAGKRMGWQTVLLLSLFAPLVCGCSGSADNQVEPDFNRAELLRSDIMNREW